LQSSKNQILQKKNRKQTFNLLEGWCDWEKTNVWQLLKTRIDVTWICVHYEQFIDVRV